MSPEEFAYRVVMRLAGIEAALWMLVVVVSVGVVVELAVTLWWERQKGKAKGRKR